MKNQLITKKITAKMLVTEYLLVIAILILVGVTAIVEPKFFSSSNLTNIMRQFGPLSMVSLGMTFVIMGGFIDLSVAGSMSLVAVVTVASIDYVGQWPALFIGILVGALSGALNSLVILSCGALTSAEALFITFGMSTLYGALALIFSGGITQHMSWLLRERSIFDSIGQGSLGIMSVSFIIFLICLLILYIFQKRTYTGRAIMLTGGNKVAAELSGIKVKKSITTIYVICGIMAAIGSIMLFSRVTTASPVIGKNYETNAILSVVVGGTTLKGGSGSVLKTVLGVMLVTLLSNCLNMLGISTYLQSVFKGAILILAIWLDSRKEMEGSR